MTARSGRYAIYLAPEAESALGRFVNSVIGYDANSGEDVPQSSASDLPHGVWEEIASDPRRYGAHATLKAPFRLAHNCDLEELKHDLAEFAAGWRAFNLGPLVVTCITRETGGGFVALAQQNISRDLSTLAAATVVRFDRFRAPLTAAEIARHRPERFTKRQRRNLKDYGYPFILDDFTFHITLTNVLASPEPITRALADRFAMEVGAVNFCVAALYLFEQTTLGERFRVAGRFPLENLPVAAPSNVPK